MASVKCPRCGNNAGYDSGFLDRHKSNEVNAKGGFKGCPAASRTLDQAEKEFGIDPYDARRRDELKEIADKVRMQRKSMHMRSVSLKRGSPIRTGRLRYEAEHCGPCDKNLYRSIGQAQRTAQRLERLDGIPLYVYRCPVDDEKYHLTKMEVHDERGEVL